MTIAITLVVILALAALIFGILALAGKGGSAMIPASVILLALAFLIGKIPIG